MPLVFPESLDVIAVGAHPDDVEIACGGTVARLTQQGYRVGIVDLTDGEPTPGSPGPEVRLAEAAEAAKILGIPIRETLTLPNRRLFDSFESRIALATMFRKYRPSVVLGILGKTPLASPDHWQATQITDAAVFYSRLSKWEEHFAGWPPHNIRKQAWYPLGLRQLPIDNGTNSGSQGFVVDISETLAIKLASIRAYKTQFPPAKESVFQLIESQNRFFGASAGFEAGEYFLSASTLGVCDLVKTLCGGM
jgi:bacillithiol biosynthesis deacetylase BshB1